MPRVPGPAKKLDFYTKPTVEEEFLGKIKCLGSLFLYYDLAQGGRYVAGRDDFAFPRLILTQRVAKKFGFRVKTNVVMLFIKKLIVSTH